MQPSVRLFIIITGAAPFRTILEHVFGPSIWVRREAGEFELVAGASSRETKSVKKFIPGNR